MKNLFTNLIFIFLLICISSNAQQPGIVWQSFYDGQINDVDYFKNMVIDPVGNIFVLCGTKGDVSGYDVDITTYKINNAGQVEWNDVFTGPGNHSLDAPIDIVYDQNGAVISVGTTRDSGVVVIKYNLSGTRQWVYYDPDENEVIYSITIDNLGNIYLAGQDRIPSSSNFDATLIKIDANGSQVYHKQFVYGGTSSGWVAKFVSIRADLNGDLVAIGDCRRTSSNYYSAVIAKITTGGSELWSYVHSTDSLYMGSFYNADIAFDQGNNIYAVTAAGQGIQGGYSDVVILKMDNPTGSIIWNTKYDGGNNGPDNIRSVHSDNYGNIFISTYSRYSGSNYSHVLSKLDASNGMVIWSNEIRNFGQTGNSKFTYNDCYFDTNGDFLVSSPDLSISTIKRYNTDADTIWTKYIPGAFVGTAGNYTWMDIWQTTVLKGPDGKIYLGCSGNQTIQSDPTDVMVACLSENPSAVGEEDKIIPDKFVLGQNYPNPFNPNTIIGYQLSVSSKVILKVYDILGNEITTLVNEEKPAGHYEVEFNSSILSSGIYFYQLNAGDFVQTKKLILLK